VSAGGHDQLLPYAHAKKPWGRSPELRHALLGYLLERKLWRRFAHSPN
jgi:hypothetical protein